MLAVMEESRNKKHVEGGDREILYSKAIKAGKRIYYLDVKRNLKDDLFVAVTESKKIQSKDGLQISFEKHKIFLYKEDFEKFMEGMQDVISYIKNSNLKKSAEDVVEPEEEETIHGDSPEEDMASGAIKLVFRSTASSSALWLTSVPSPQMIFRLPIPALCRSSFAE